MQNGSTFSTVDAYIEQFPANIQSTLRSIRAVIRESAPDATESISYGMPAYKCKGRPIAYFAAFAHHIGFYATPSAHSAFSDRLAKYTQGKGSVQFPIDQVMPLDLIASMTRFNYERLDK